MAILPLFLFTTYLTTFLSTSRAEMCGSKTYANGSLYEANLHYLLSTLRINALKNDGFYTDTFGKKPDKVYGLAMCYAFANQSDCSTCLSNTDQFCRSRNSTKGPNLKSVSSFEFSCLIRYSDESFVSTLDPALVYMGENGPNVSDTSNFPNLLDGLMRKLSVEASTLSRMFRAGYVNSTEPKKIYGLVQCSRDLSAKSCSECLDGCINFLQQNPVKEQAGRVANMNCYARFSPYLFFPSELLALPSESFELNSQESKIHLFLVLLLAFITAILL
ncbi:hypothetical protein LUZ60_005498 [Juncus effusus]|nr:hypothetical protein LUZ60_005498 [Juncus effusus]